MRTYLFLLLLIISSCTPENSEENSEEVINVHLDFDEHLVNIHSPDGAGMIPWSGFSNGKTHMRNSYSELKGFPHDTGNNEFSEFLDIAFSLNYEQGMGLSNTWASPNGFQSPKGSLSDHYNQKDWLKQDFGDYEANILSTERYDYHKGERDWRKQSHYLKGPKKGHIVPLFKGAMKRATKNNAVFVPWVDLYYFAPRWISRHGNPIPEKYWDEYALYITYFVKYLVSKHGIPIYGVSVQNEPRWGSRVWWNEKDVPDFMRVLRHKMNEAGLHGVRLSTCMWNNAGGFQRKSMAREIIHNPSKASAIDIIGGHMLHREPPYDGPIPENTSIWAGASDYEWFSKPGQKYSTYEFNPKNTAGEKFIWFKGFIISNPSQIDEMIRRNTWFYKSGKINLISHWQIYQKMGMKDFGTFSVPSEFEIEKDGIPQMVDALSLLCPYVRPGMSMVKGSMGNAPFMQYSVDGFSGPGHENCIIIANDSTKRTFRIKLKNSSVDSFKVYQADENTRKHYVKAIAGANEVTITVPENSITTLVAKHPSTRRQIFYVTSRNQEPDTKAKELIGKLKQKYDLTIVHENLTNKEKDTYRTKRHPVNPLKTSLYILDEHIQKDATRYAYRAVAAPVVAIGSKNLEKLGLKPGKEYKWNSPLAYRDEKDPPVQILEQGSPKACGKRYGLKELHVQKLLNYIERISKD